MKELGAAVIVVAIAVYLLMQVSPTPSPEIQESRRTVTASIAPPSNTPTENSNGSLASRWSPGSIGPINLNATPTPADRLKKGAYGQSDLIPGRWQTGLYGQSNLATTTADHSKIGPGLYSQSDFIPDRWKAGPTAQTELSATPTIPLKPSSK